MTKRKYHWIRHHAKGKVKLACRGTEYKEPISDELWTSLDCYWLVTSDWLAKITCKTCLRAVRKAQRLGLVTPSGREIRNEE